MEDLKNGSYVVRMRAWRREKKELKNEGRRRLGKDDISKRGENISLIV